MDISEAARILAERYNSAPKDHKVVRAHLFGIQYADEIRNMSCSEIVALAELPDSYGTEVRKGIKLSEFVILKKT